VELAETSVVDAGLVAADASGTGAVPGTVGSPRTTRATVKGAAARPNERAKASASPAQLDLPSSCRPFPKPALRPSTAVPVAGSRGFAGKDEQYGFRLLISAFLANIAIQMDGYK
jgi:hypothetical protein